MCHIHTLFICRSPGDNPSSKHFLAIAIQSLQSNRTAIELTNSATLSQASFLAISEPIHCHARPPYCICTTKHEDPPCLAQLQLLFCIASNVHSVSQNTHITMQTFVQSQQAWSPSLQKNNNIAEAIASLPPHLKHKE